MNIMFYHVYSLYIFILQNGDFVIEEVGLLSRGACVRCPLTNDGVTEAPDRRGGPGRVRPLPSPMWIQEMFKILHANLSILVLFGVVCLFFG